MYISCERRDFRGQSKVIIYLPTSGSTRNVEMHDQCISYSPCFRIFFHTMFAEEDEKYYNSKSTKDTDQEYNDSSVLLRWPLHDCQSCRLRVFSLTKLKKLTGNALIFPSNWSKWHPLLAILISLVKQLDGCYWIAYTQDTRKIHAR